MIFCLHLNSAVPIMDDHFKIRNFLDFKYFFGVFDEILGLQFTMQLPQIPKRKKLSYLSYPRRRHYVLWTKNRTVWTYTIYDHVAAAWCDVISGTKIKKINKNEHETASRRYFRNTFVVIKKNKILSAGNEKSTFFFRRPNNVRRKVRPKDTQNFSLIFFPSNNKL